jgi:hypothetical protein
MVYSRNITSAAAITHRDPPQPFPMHNIPTRTTVDEPRVQEILFERKFSKPYCPLDYGILHNQIDLDPRN